MNNVYKFKDRIEFRKWLINNHSTEKECWIIGLKRGKPQKGFFAYLDAVEEALCFGWIDSILKNIDGIPYQKFSPRVKNSNWTVLNLARVERLNKLGLMTEDGLKVLPKNEFSFDDKIINDIKKSGVYEAFKNFPELYQKIRLSNLQSMKNISFERYKKSFDNFVKKTKENKMIPGWDDYGRLLK